MRDRPKLDGRVELIRIPRTDEATGPEGTIAALRYLRAHLAPRVNGGGRIVGVERVEDGVAYKLIVP